MIKSNKKIHYEDYYERKQRKIKRKFKVINLLWYPLRIVLFPIFLAIRIWNWTYYQD